MDIFQSPSDSSIEQNYQSAKEKYAAFGIDTDAAIKTALNKPISMHCWQVDDVAGFENLEGTTSGGIMSTGSYPGRARNIDEARQDLEEVLRLLPGEQRLNLHASYGDFSGGAMERDLLDHTPFVSWAEWAKAQGIQLDFNPTYFGHPLANDGYTLSHADPGVRQFWIDHGIASRNVATYLAEVQGSICVNNHWVPDGAKDHPADRLGPRERLAAALDEVLDEAHGISEQCVDAVEGKLFGIGAEDYTVGTNDFYANYALSREKTLCIDLGHYHLSESVADKVSAHLPFHKQLLVHTSRPIRWDSDHVVLVTDEVREMFQEVIRASALDRAYLALDFFDASINRIGAYVIGTRATRQALLIALLEPSALCKQLEAEGKNAQKLALMEHAKALPHGAVWDKLCLQAGVPTGVSWIAEMEKYEVSVLQNRS